MLESELSDFARAFGDALYQFLLANGMTQAEAARRLGLPGGKGKARLSTYCHDSRKGRRAKPDAEILYRVCVNLGFSFEYGGYKISAAVLNNADGRVAEEQIEQLQIEFEGQINLSNQTGTASVKVRRPPRRIELAISPKEVSQSSPAKRSS
jgi:transcriptional regulator with XRE-family HTH domain